MNALKNPRRPVGIFYAASQPPAVKEGPPPAGYFSHMGKVTKRMLRGENPVRLQPKGRASAHRIFPPKNPRFLRAVGRVWAVETASAADGWGSLRFPARTGPDLAVEQTCAALLSAPPWVPHTLRCAISRARSFGLKDSQRKRRKSPPALIGLVRWGHVLRFHNVGKSSQSCLCKWRLPFGLFCVRFLIR